MSKSVLPIFIKGGGFTVDRHVKVPCRLPDSFTLTARASGVIIGATAYLSGDWVIDEVEIHDSASGAYVAAEQRAESILATIKATLGITGPVPPGSPLPAIALAYESEVAAHEACVKALHSLPPYLWSIGTASGHPSDETATGVRSNAARMLAKYVEHVFEQAANEVAP